MRKSAVAVWCDVWRVCVRARALTGRHAGSRRFHLFVRNFGAPHSLWLFGSLHFFFWKSSPRGPDQTGSRACGESANNSRVMCLFDGDNEVAGRKKQFTLEEKKQKKTAHHATQTATSWNNSSFVNAQLQFLLSLPLKWEQLCHIFFFFQTLKLDIMHILPICWWVVMTRISPGETFPLWRHTYWVGWLVGDYSITVIGKKPRHVICQGSPLVPLRLHARLKRHPLTRANERPLNSASANSASAHLQFWTTKKLLSCRGVKLTFVAGQILVSFLRHYDWNHMKKSRITVYSTIVSVPVMGNKKMLTVSRFFMTNENLKCRYRF